MKFSDLLRGLRPNKRALTPREVEELYEKKNGKKKGAFNSASNDIKQESRVPDNRHIFGEPLSAQSFSKSSKPLSSQDDSPLFRLPREIRLLIWEYAMPGQDIYIAAHKDRWLQAAKLTDLKWYRVKNLLTVPLVCKMSYLESIQNLYALNSFWFGYNYAGAKDAVTKLSTMLPKTHIDSIRHVTTTWHFVFGDSQYYDSHPQAWHCDDRFPTPDSKRVWEQVCTQIAQMSHLQSLKVVIATSGDRRMQMGKQSEPELLQPLTKITHIKQFEIYLAWENAEGDSMWAKAPFKVNRKFVDNERYGRTIPMLPEED